MDKIRVVTHTWRQVSCFCRINRLKTSEVFYVSQYEDLLKGRPKVIVVLPGHYHQEDYFEVNEIIDRYEQKGTRVLRLGDDDTLPDNIKPLCGIPNR